MMIDSKGKVCRNLQEQVQKNKEDIEELQQGGITTDAVKDVVQNNVSVVDDEKIAHIQPPTTQQILSKMEGTEHIVVDEDETNTKVRIDLDNDVKEFISFTEEITPSQASGENQLADKDFVNSSIATNTANFKGTFTTTQDLPTTDVSNNDYAFVVSHDEAGNTVYSRYKYVASTTSWQFEYNLNNSSFTANQWATINSGVVAEDKSKINRALLAPLTTPTEKVIIGVGTGNEQIQVKLGTGLSFGGTTSPFTLNASGGVELINLTDGQTTLTSEQLAKVNDNPQNVKISEYINQSDKNIFTYVNTDMTYHYYYNCQDGDYHYHIRRMRITKFSGFISYTDWQVANSEYYSLSSGTSTITDAVFQTLKGNQHSIVNSRNNILRMMDNTSSLKYSSIEFGLNAIEFHHVQFVASSGGADHSVAFEDINIGYYRITSSATSISDDDYLKLKNSYTNMRIFISGTEGGIYQPVINTTDNLNNKHLTFLSIQNNVADNTDAKLVYKYIKIDDGVDSSNKHVITKKTIEITGTIV